MHAELLANLSQVCTLSELGQRLAPNKHGVVFAQGDPVRDVHTRLRESERRFSALADETDQIAVSLLECPNVEDVRRLKALHSVVVETGNVLPARN